MNIETFFKMAVAVGSQTAILRKEFNSLPTENRLQMLVSHSLVYGGGKVLKIQSIRNLRESSRVLLGEAIDLADCKKMVEEATDCLSF